MGAFFNSFFEYAVQFVVLAVIALAGVATGKKLRENKNEKAAQRPRINR